jgi:hypothetical protein
MVMVAEEQASDTPTDRDAIREELIRVGCLELAEHLRDAAANGRAYITLLAGYAVSSKHWTPPAQGIHPLIAQLIREIMADADVSMRRR